MVEALRNFQLFLDREAAKSSPLYTALTAQVSQDLQDGGPISQVLVAAPERQRIPNLLFAAVQRTLFDEPDSDLAEYYPSLGGTRAPDAELAETFSRFVLAHRDRIEQVLATGETQTNEARRAAQLFPAFGWAQACTRRPLGLIEVGTSAGLLLHADRYAYVYEFEDGSELGAGEGSADGVPTLRCAVTAPAAQTTPQAIKALTPFVSKDLRIASRVGLDLNPLDPADPEARAWLDALVWPEHAERRARLRAALDHAARRPVRLRKGDALRILPDAVDSVPDNAIPCVFVSNSLAHWTADGRADFAALIRRLGTRRDLVCVIKEGYATGLGLFTGRTHNLTEDEEAPYEVIGAAVYLGGQERLFRLGTGELHGVGLTWSPTPLPTNQ
ncbi:MAG TPA: DUF2332 domain-containing protein [Actinocrinis sp.]|uniref:DUF2332 domain-containing protein n=1 Tax=Actinocrinis sp. TaxID=1920516 RepID=UPI002DDC9AB2|nr:DUF2332 domain-containing protein [Actinocrinis sp.]HEV2346233.1 DUF2332 domain-containing protein [Actinocrinis sp.]